MIGADAKELQPEPLRSEGKNAFELVQGVNLEKSDGRGAGKFSRAPARSRSHSCRDFGLASRGSPVRCAMSLATSAQWAAAGAAWAWR